MARLQPNESLAALLVEAGWSAAELARAVNVLGTDRTPPLRYDRTSVAHWLSGSCPRGTVPDLVAETLSRRAGRLVTAQETGLAPLPGGTSGARRAVRGAEADPVTRLVSLARDDINPARRPFLARSAYTPVLPGLPDWSARDTAPGSAAPHRATSADVQTLYDMTGVFADLDARHGGGHARSALAAYLADDAGHLLTASAPAAVRRGLLTAAAQLAHLLAGMTADADHAGLAQHYHRISLALAHRAGCRPVYAITLRAMSVQALRRGHGRHALRLADTAVRAAGPGADGATLAFLFSQRAVTLARDGRSRAALSDLTSAETHHGRSPGEPGPFTAYPRAGLEYQRARTLALLGRRPDALSALRVSAAHRSVAQRRAFAVTQASLAETLLATGHLEESCVHWHRFLDVYPHLHSARADHFLKRLRAGLRPHQRQRHAAAVWDRARQTARAGASG